MQDSFERYWQALQILAARYGVALFGRDAWREGFDLKRPPPEAFFSEFPDLRHDQARREPAFSLSLPVLCSYSARSEWRDFSIASDRPMLLMLTEGASSGKVVLVNALVSSALEAPFPREVHYYAGPSLNAGVLSILAQYNVSFPGLIHRHRPAAEGGPNTLAPLPPPGSLLVIEDAGWRIRSPDAVLDWIDWAISSGCFLVLIERNAASVFGDDWRLARHCEVNGRIGAAFVDPGVLSDNAPAFAADLWSGLRPPVDTRRVDFYAVSLRPGWVACLDFKAQ